MIWRWCTPLGLALLTCACGADTPPPAARCAASPIAETSEHHCLVVATTDLATSGGITVVDTHSGCAWTNITAIHQDAVLVADDDDLYVINREGGDNVQRLSPASGFATLWQRSVGNLSNPQAMAIAGDTGFIPLYRTGTVAVVTLSDAGLDPITEIVLPTEHEADGRAEPAFVWVRGDTLYVMVNGLGDYPHCGTGRGRIYAYDTADYTPQPVFDGQTALDLAFCNPGAWGWLDEDRILVGASGDFKALQPEGTEAVDDGGLEVINLAEGRSEGVILTEADMGDLDLLDLTVGAEGRVWITLTGLEVDGRPSFQASVHALRLYGAAADNLIGEPVWVGEGIFDIVEVDDVLWIADRAPECAGLIPIDVGSGEQLSPVIQTGFAPFSIAAIEAPSGCFMGGGGLPP